MNRGDLAVDFRVPVEPVDLEACLPDEWWKTLFNENYLRTDGDIIENEANTVQDVDILLDILDLRPEDRILDMCCGQGRHCIELFKRGYRNVTGLDYSGYLLELAAQRAKDIGMPATFIRGDSRNPPLARDSFDAIICMGNSFGYFSDDRDDFLQIERITGLLKRGGRLFLDLIDGCVLWNNFEVQSSEWLDDRTVINRERTLARTGRRLISREVIYSLDKGLIADQIYAETLYSDADIRVMLDKTAYMDICVYRDATVISTRNEDLGMLAHRMIVTASRA